MRSQVHGPDAEPDEEEEEYKPKDLRKKLKDAQKWAYHR